MRAHDTTLPIFPDRIADVIREECGVAGWAGVAEDLIRGIEDTVQILGADPTIEAWMVMSLGVIRSLGQTDLARALLCRFSGCLGSPESLGWFERVSLSPELLWMMRQKIVIPTSWPGGVDHPWLRLSAARLPASGLTRHELTGAKLIRTILTTFAPVFDISSGEGAWDLRELMPPRNGRRAGKDTSTAWLLDYAGRLLHDLAATRGWSTTPVLLAA